MFEVEYIPECCELVKINKETFNLEVSKLKTIKCLCFYEFFSQPCKYYVVFIVTKANASTYELRIEFQITNRSRKKVSDSVLRKIVCNCILQFIIRYTQYGLIRKK